MLLFSKIKKFIGCLRTKKAIMKGSIFSNIVYCNNHVNIIYDAFKECINGKKDATFEEKLIYLEKKIKMGHESVLEHSNVVTYYIFNNEYSKELSEVLEVCKYLNPKVKVDSDITYLILGGSIRGYKHIIRNIRNQDNRLAKEILNQLYSLNSCYFIDFIEDGIMTKENFLDVEDEKAEYYNTAQKDKYDIVNMDNLDELIGKVPLVEFNPDDVLDLATITIHIKDVSRIISQQLTRHRCGITQLSQRYVNYSEEFKFNSPADFKPELYDKDHKYVIKLKEPNMQNPFEFDLTLQELGDMLMGIYPQLIEQKLLKEDARAYLPNNATTSLYMTFTIRNFIKFLELRTDDHAQAEVRILAKELFNYIIIYLKKYFNTSFFGDDIYEKYLSPKYKQTPVKDPYEEIDEPID